jgi:DoxX-like family
VKNSKTLYRAITGLMAAFMLLASIPDLLRIPQAVAIFGHLGYPLYLLPFLGTAKTLGVVVVLVPGFRRLKEWAFAGLVFDLIGALYSHLSVGDPPSGWMPAVVGLILVGGSYLSYRRQPIPRDGNVMSTSRAAVDTGIHPRPVGIR